MIESTILTIIGEKRQEITPAFALPLRTTLIPIQIFQTLNPFLLSFVPFPSISACSGVVHYKRLMAYQGLVNEGATCYLNSLLQTLFMTYDFRQNIYEYLHDPRKIAEKDSIPFQLQKLFVNLQTQGQPGSTRDLLRSFQWTQAQAFQQHDVQEFCRKLFDAIQASHKNTFWIKELFGFLISSYIDCGTHRSTRPEEYLDLSLPVRNQYTQQLYSSLQECLHSYLTPEELEGVECSGCEAKVPVKKGMGLQSLPVIFTLQLNRFQLNYQTMQRQKINSFLYYPEILQLHRFVKPFDQIQLKGLPSSLKSKAVTVQKEKSHRTVDFSAPSFDAAKTKKRKTSDDKIATKEQFGKEHVSYFDEENRGRKKEEGKQLSKEEEKSKNMEILADLKQNKFKDLKQIKKPAKKPEPDLEEDMLFSTLASGYKFDQPNVSGGDPFEKKPTFQTTQTSYQHEEQCYDPTKQYPDGTYALYAVLVHSGGSYGGHYYAYIFDGKDWFKFDDARVTKVPRYQARQYGSNTGASSGTNAYLLFYRNVRTFRDLSQLQIPTELYEKVRIENEKSKNREEVKSMSTVDRERRLFEINSAVIVKVFSGSNADPITIKIENRAAESLLDLRERIRVALSLTDKDENWRLRRYNKSDDSMHEVYQGDASLQALGFRQNIYLIVDRKTDEQVFEEYDPRRITVKVNIWRPNIIMVTEKKLNPVKIAISELAPYSQLYSLIQQKTDLARPLVIRRNYTSAQPISSLLIEDNAEKRLIDLRFFSNITLYVEELEEGSSDVRWAREFQKEKFRCNIRFNNPRAGDARDEEMYFDSRRTLGQLKKQLSTIIAIPEDMFRIKKGKQMPQLTVFKKKLSDLRFINNEVLFLQQGKSSQGSIVLKRGTAQLIDGQLEYLIHQQSQFDISNDLVTVADLCRKISEATGIPAEVIRIREYLACQFKEIYSPNELIMRIRNKTVVWEQKTTAEEQRGLQVYLRVFDPLTLEIGPLKEMFVDGTASYEEFTLLLEEETGIPADRILVHRPLSTYCDLNALFDCEWTEVRFIDDVVKEQPLCLRCDGEFIIVKQADEPYKPPKITKKAAAAATIASKEKAGQAQLKITVIAEKDQQPEPEAPIPAQPSSNSPSLPPDVSS